MSFGENILKKFGWSEGKGLGREENGIKSFIKPKLKANLSGIGHNDAEEHSFHWWDHLYNKAANNITIKKKETGAVEIVRTEDLKISTKKSSLRKNKDLSGYGNFVKSCVLEGDKIIEAANIEGRVEEEASLELIKNYTDQELFKICGGLTAHKGARHGITMSAKLARLEEQEKKFLEKTDKTDKPEKKKKRKRDDKSTVSCNVISENNDMLDVNYVEENSETKIKKKKKKKKKKNEEDHSDSENVISYEDVPVVVEQEVCPTADCEFASSELKYSSKKKKKKRKKEN